MSEKPEVVEVWTSDLSEYHGGLIEPFNVRWKHKDGTTSPIGSGLKRDDSIMIFFVKKEVTP